MIFHSQPTWINEGLAEFYSTFVSTMRKGLSAVGMPLVYCLRVTVGGWVDAGRGALMRPPMNVAFVAES